MNTLQKAAKIKNELEQFRGTETWFRHSLFRKFLYTEGVQFLAEEAGCYWLLDMIFGFQYEIEAVRAEVFQTWDMTINEDKTATLSCGDGNDHTVFTHILDYTDFPLPKIRLFLTDSVLLLPNEY